MRINSVGNGFDGDVEIFYRGVGTVQYARLELLGTVNQDGKLTIDWANIDQAEHNGYVSHDVISQDTFKGCFVATRADKKDTVMGYSVWHKIYVNDKTTND